MNITLRQLKAFVAVADSGSFTQAAAALHMSQSALSGLIKELEHHTGLCLFDRTTRQLHISSAGARLLPPARRVLNELAVFAEEVDNTKNRHHGQVRLAVSQQLAASAMPALMAAFCRAHPHIRVHLADCSVEQVLRQVQHVEVDFGIGPEREYGEGIAAEFLFALPFYVVLPPGHELAMLDEVPWSALRVEKLITLSGPFTERLAAALPPDLAERVLRPDFQVNFLSTALGMTRTGLGATLCLPYAGDWVRQQGLCMRPLCQPTVSRRFLLYRRHSRSLSPAAAAFGRFVQQQGTAVWRGGGAALPHADGGAQDDAFI